MPVPPAWWWQKWIDPLGEHTAFSGVDARRRPYPIAGTWERYSFRAGKSHIETRWGTHFINAACLSRYHGTTNIPMSRLLTFSADSPDVTVECYLHTDEWLPQGWYSKAKRVLKLHQPFLSAGGPQATTGSVPKPASAQGSDHAR